MKELSRHGMSRQPRVWYIQEMRGCCKSGGRGASKKIRSQFMEGVAGQISTQIKPACCIFYRDNVIGFKKPFSVERQHGYCPTQCGSLAIQKQCLNWIEASKTKEPFYAMKQGIRARRVG